MFARLVHQTCIDVWLKQSQLCPLCNQNVVSGALAAARHLPGSPVAAAIDADDARSAAAECVVKVDALSHAAARAALCAPDA